MLQYFRTLNTRVSVVYIETWQGSNQAPIDKSQSINRALHNFNDYTSRKLYRVEKDTTQLLTFDVTIKFIMSWKFCKYLRRVRGVSYMPELVGMEKWQAALRAANPPPIFNGIIARQSPK
ncbi:Disintegrin and metalloproteinase domain-containing protein 22 [Homalodisca vitripennis]|nr:Disintegrin and metalloproteinase domain-containing protein 22 [Homalodisca vitripennis]